VIEGYSAQWSLPNKVYSNIQDDPVVAFNIRGTLSFAMTSQPNSRYTMVFINLGDNEYLDELGFAPFARVISGMGVVDQLYSGYD